MKSLDIKMIDLYSDYLISSFSQTTSVGLSRLLNGEISHDKITRFLSKDLLINDDLFQIIKPFLREIENASGKIIVDDFILKKPYSRETDIICYHYDHTSGKQVKGINILNFVYYTRLLDGTDIYIPLAFKIISKTEKYFDKKSKRPKRKSKYTKNELMQSVLKDLTFKYQIKYSYICFDSWFSSMCNFNFIEKVLKKNFVCAIKSNRKVALNYDDKSSKNFIDLSELDIGTGGTRLVYLKGMDSPLRITKLVFTNGKDGETKFLYLVTNDLSLNVEQMCSIYQKRWKVEEYHKSLKQNVSLEKSPTRKVLTQSNHIFCSIVGYFKLQKMNIKKKDNHFKFKNMIHLKAIRIAYYEFFRNEKKIGYVN